ncbi:sensor histidine kinase [Mariniblastus fucicola]|uniref:histidine kinase n=1 Tax=Mariniblastus fucicola TaxID=980251 RepID=A0A5B9P8P5_9BACT|nr:sensor histidine kinase [Mariniblastus fucicola]QEG22668.1 Sensor protein FixL [Mariniblastus fucicola]
MHEEHKMLESELRGQTRVLRRLAQGASLEETLDTLVAVAEETRPDMIGSILLLDRQSGLLRHGASRSLPESYCNVVDGTAPGPEVGSCGTAAYFGKRIIVEDIATDPLWKSVRQFALDASLRACWSEPIMDSAGEILGTFAMYYREPRKPNQSELDFVTGSANLAALAIERVRYQQEVERERAVLKTLVASVPDALISGGLDRRITHFSRSASRIFGYEPEEVLGKLTSVLYANPDDFQLLAKERFNPESHENLEIKEVMWRRKSGETFPGELMGATIRDESGTPHGYIGMVRDITDRKIAEAKLAESQHKLLQSERLAAMGQMVSAIAHESRNALQRIQVGVDVLRYEIAEGTEEREDLERIFRAKHDLEHLHNDLRSFAGPIQLEMTDGDLSDVWRLAWSNLQVSHADRKAELIEHSTCDDLTCRFDAFRLEQVFRNLFENSLAAGRDPVQVTVTCANTDIDGKPAISISVRDNGPGMPDEVKARVFDAFHTTKAKGTGLGMAIAKRFIDAHEGSITVVDGKIGAEFRISLPRHA